MAHVKLSGAVGNIIRTVDPRLMSYNVEMTEITGGTFWKAYTPEQIAGTEAFPPLTGFADLGKLMQYYPPIDLGSAKLRKLAAAFGPVWVRVSGSWATKTYYDFDGHTGGVAPAGFQSVLSREQWIGVLDFVRAVDGKLLVSVGNCEGNHPNGGPLDLSQAKLLFDFSAEYGVPIDAAEFMNEPNMMEVSGAPRGYSPADYVRDQDLFNAWVREHYPDCLIVGPCSTDSSIISMGSGGKGGAGIGDIMPCCTTDQLMDGSRVKLDIFSYHYYNGVSERLASVMPAGHWDPSQALSEEYLAMAPRCARAFAPLRDKYCPGAQMWVTESGDAGGGGDTWASTYLDVPRTLNELGSFATITDGIIFHNTLASSDYGFLRHGSFEPRPNYFAALLWNTLMGSTVYDIGIPVAEGAHVFCHSRKDGRNGCVYLVINNSPDSISTAELDRDATVYALDGNGNMRSTLIYLNGTALTLGEDDALPGLCGKAVKAGSLELAPGSCTFIVMDA